jgi:hypothetical protein
MLLHQYEDMMKWREINELNIHVSLPVGFLAQIIEYGMKYTKD